MREIHSNNACSDFVTKVIGTLARLQPLKTESPVKRRVKHGSEVAVEYPKVITGVIFYAPFGYATYIYPENFWSSV